MKSTTTPSVLAALGYQVLSVELGVYVLLADEDSDERLVALMLSKGEPVDSTLHVELFLEAVPEDVAAVDVVEVWQQLDARRFAETGLTPRALELGPVAPSDLHRESLSRPGGGVRLAMALPSGDVVCLC
jgi:hypothetical protein